MHLIREVLYTQPKEVAKILGITRERIKYFMKQEVFNFGKYKGVPVEEALRRDPGYYNWMLTSDFTSDTKQVLTRIKMRDLRRGQGC